MITFNGVTSDSLGIIVDGYSSKPIAKRRVESQHIPGRNGDLLIDEGVYDNYTQSYTIYWLPTTPPSSVSAWLNQSGYFKLVDSDFPEYYRMAQVSGPVDPVNHGDCYMEASISFNCKPQWFLNSGNAWNSHIITAPDVQVTLENPTNEIALPLVYANKQSNNDTMTISVNGEQFQLIPYGTTTGYYIDSELKEVYYSTFNRNGAFVGKFPTLKPGTNTLVMSGSSGDNAYVSIMPRWWIA